MPTIAQNAEKLSSNDLEVRIMLAFKASDAAVQKILPAGWELNSPALGPNKGFNLGVVFIDQTTSQDPDGTPLSPRSYVVLIVPAKKSGTDIVGAMVIGGFICPEVAPGAYGMFVAANVAVDRRQHTVANGKVSIEETWEIHANDGSAIEFQIAFTRGVPARSKMEASIYSAAKPDFYRVYRFEQVADLVRSTATGVDRVSKLSIKTSGPQLAQLFDGSEHLISVTSIPYYYRSIYLPVS